MLTGDYVSPPETARVHPCQKYIAEGANTPALEDPAHKPRLLKRPDSSQWSLHTTPFTDRTRETCGLGFVFAMRSKLAQA